MAARAGIEPVVGFLQVCVEAAASEIENSADAHIGTQKLWKLRDVVSTWPTLSPEFRAALITVTLNRSTHQQ
jgi:hypothetical protein